MKLRTKFILVLFAVLLLLTAANVGALSVYRDNIVTQERENVNETADLTANQIDKTIKVREDELSVAGQNYPNENLEGASEYFAEFLLNSQHFYSAKVVND